MRRAILRLVGVLYIIIALIGFVPGTSHILISSNTTYNVFMLVFGFMALGVADIGADYSQWFAMMFGAVLLMLILSSLIGYFGDVGKTVYWGNTLLNILALVLMIYVARISYKKR